MITKQSLFDFFDFILVEFKWYRKRIGGKWYRVREQDVSGFATTEHWTQEAPDEQWDTIIKTEEYKAQK